MKRALELLEKTKHTMPHLPRPQTKDSDSDSQDSSTAKSHPSRGQKRNPSAKTLGKRVTIDAGGHKPNSGNTLSRKITASSTRVGSSSSAQQSANVLKKRTSFIENKGDTSKPSAVYELSLLKSKGGQMKPPSKLRPIDQNLSKSQTATFTNTASALLQIENAYQKEMMNEIEDDLTDYLDANKIMAQMSTAFGDSVDKPKKDEQTKTKLRKENKSSLDPILEETPGALVLFTNNMTLQEQRAKKNEILKQKVKKLTAKESEALKALPQDPNQKQYDSETFITGTKIAEAPEESQEDEKILALYETSQKQKKKHYKYEEDELLDDLDQHERDMNEMLKYLSEVEDMLKGQDLKSIQSMIDVTKETMQQHFTAYDKFKGQIETIEQQATEAIKTLSLYEPSESAVLKGKSSKQLDRIIEEKKESEVIGRKDQKVSQEQSKTSIVDTLVNMNQTMKDFSTDLESRLDRVYKKGASKKFGYDSIANSSSI